MMDEDATGTGEGRRAAAMQALRDRIEAEALAKAQQQERRKAEVAAEAQAEALALGAALMAKEEEAPGYTAQQRGLTMADDEDLAGAVDSVRRLEAQLEAMMRPQTELQQCLAQEEREHRKTAAKLLQLGERDQRSAQRQQRDHEGMEDGVSPAHALQDALGLLG